MKKLRLFGIDPGVTTGLAWCTVTMNGQTVVESLKDSRSGWTQIGPVRGLDAELRAMEEVILTLFEAFPSGVDAIICEDFILRVGPGVRSSSDRDGLAPVRLISTLWALLAAERQQMALQGTFDWVLPEVVFQSAAQAKGCFTDTRLRRSGLWVPGKQHSRDAFRHIGTYLLGHL